ncbi:integrase [Consotaella salsifontis]|uniref:Site-specific recombinase XerD n=1 Tax=Consotaella salsifontis TaxID=1365950 RepID=A0A1T4RLJ6_9HYPH|nr:site-specific integrase [Consotaella salsifontis]SKA16666.1 Site-specific recombinase XerD [Consotaella salsifontis]
MATIRRLRGRWQAMVRRKGLQPRAKSFDSKADAEKWARSLEAELDRCGNLPDTRLAEKMTVRELLERYLKEITPSKRSASTETYRIRGMLSRSICFRTLALLTPGDVAGYRDERLTHVAPATVIRELNTLGHAIDIARKEWGVHLPQNPCRLIRRPSPPRGRNRRLQPGEEQRLLDAANSGRNPWIRPLIILALETAMRQGELLSLTWENVDLEKRIAHLPMTKNGEERDVPLSQRATEILRQLKGERTGERVIDTSKSAVEQAWAHLRARAGSVDLHFHDLRHEAVTRLLERGFNVIETATISGHKELRMLQRYAHIKAVDLVDRL